MDPPVCADGIRDRALAGDRVEDDGLRSAHALAARRRGCRWWRGRRRGRGTGIRRREQFVERATHTTTERVAVDRERTRYLDRGVPTRARCGVEEREFEANVIAAAKRAAVENALDMKILRDARHAIVHEDFFAAGYRQCLIDRWEGRRDVESDASRRLLEHRREGAHRFVFRRSRSESEHGDGAAIVLRECRGGSAERDADRERSNDSAAGRAHRRHHTSPCVRLGHEGRDGRHPVDPIARLR
jgi:hypothetical protein